MSLATDVPAGPATRRRPWAFALFCLALLGLGICGSGLWVGIPIAREYPATITIPDTVLGLTKVTDEFDLDLPPDPALAVAIYADAKKTHVVFIVAVAGLVVLPEHDLDLLLTRITARYEEVGELHIVPAGDLGGVAKCAYVRKNAWNGRRAVYCGWADHGTYSIVGFLPADDLDLAAREMLDVRSAVESR